MLNAEEILWLHINDIPTVTTSHGVGEKRVLATEENVGAGVTQIARTVLNAGEKVEVHTHQTMVEHFFFLSGKCEVMVNGGLYPCTGGDYLFIPAGVCHGISVGETTTMITIGIKTE